MANTLKLKRSAVASKVPAVGDLELGELAVNTYDGKLYTKKDNGTASIVEIGAGGGGGATNLDGLSDVAITSAASGQFLVYNGTNFVNTRTIDSGGSTPLTTVSSGGTSAEFKSSAGYNGFRVGCNSTTGVPYVALDTNSSQKAYFAYWGDGAARVSLGYSSSTDVINYGTSGTYVGRVGIQTTTPAGQLGVTCASASNKGIVVKAAASQSANLFELQNSSASALVSVDSSGNVGINNAPLTNTKLTVYGADTGSTNYSALIRNSAATNLFFVRNDGQLNTGTAASSPYNSTTGSAANVFVGSDGTLQRSTSSLRYKTDIEPATHGLAEVLQLNPVTYRSKTDGDTVYGGLIAEEVAAVGLSEFVQYADDGSPDALAYGNMVSLAFKAIQELNAKVETLETTVSTLELRLKAVEDLIT